MPLYQNRNRVKVAVAALDWNYYDIATATGINRSTLSQIANGQYHPSKDYRDRLAGYFGVPAAVLFPLDRESEVA